MYRCTRRTRPHFPGPHVRRCCRAILLPPPGASKVRNIIHDKPGWPLDAAVFFLRPRLRGARSGQQKQMPPRPNAHFDGGSAAHQTLARDGPRLDAACFRGAGGGQRWRQSSVPRQFSSLRSQDHLTVIIQTHHAAVHCQSCARVRGWHSSVPALISHAACQTRACKQARHTAEQRDLSWERGVTRKAPSTLMECWRKRKAARSGLCKRSPGLAAALCDCMQPWQPLARGCLA